MKDEVIDYKALYEKAQQELTQSQAQVQQKEDKITELNFELDKFRRYLFGTKSEKLSNLKKVDISQMHLFDLGVDQQKQEELSEQVDKEKTTIEKKTQKKRAKGPRRQHVRPLNTAGRGIHHSLFLLRQNMLPKTLHF